MAKNNVFAWDRSRSLPVAEGVESGAPVQVGDLIGVALTDRGAGGNADGYATVALNGAWDFPVATATARDVGEPVYITPAGAITTTDNSGANALFGYCLTAKAATAGVTVTIELAQV